MAAVAPAAAAVTTAQHSDCVKHVSVLGTKRAETTLCEELCHQHLRSQISDSRGAVFTVLHGEQSHSPVRVKVCILVNSARTLRAGSAQDTVNTTRPVLSFTAELLHDHHSQRPAP